ncbi:putative transmembrane reductase CYB561D1 isoform 4 [Daubentonia madagascariensis]|uniref:Transmembrane reductase CYB561D1 isoform 4 n=1 Tax=Daubentonia madagascariensis TaxID=31869 RepID=A0ABD2DZH3_DAUMA
MQPLEVGLVPAPAREPRLTRWLRRGSGILAHLVALGFTIFLTVLSRPGTKAGALLEDTSEGGRPMSSLVFSPGTLYSWPWRSASAWLRPSYSSRLSTPHSSSVPERLGSGSTGRGRL